MAGRGRRNGGGLAHASNLNVLWVREFLGKTLSVRPGAYTEHTMSNTDFKVGDAVSFMDLRPKMGVIDVLPSGRIRCQWFNTETYQFDIAEFPAACLRPLK